MERRHTNKYLNLATAKRTKMFGSTFLKSGSWVEIYDMYWGSLDPNGAINLFIELVFEYFGEVRIEVVELVIP